MSFLKKIGQFFQHGSPMRILTFGYCFIILVGTLLLMMPFASKAKGAVHFTDALFTATSASCVTGLIRFDTYTAWTLFGQIVILALIQIGGVGFMTLAITMMNMVGMKIGLASRVVMQNAISAPQVGGIENITKFIIRFTILIEGAGALFLAFFFVPQLGLLKGIWYSVFHSISAFCNAGFDLFGAFEPGSSLTSVAGNWYLNIVIMALIVVGGLGFFLWKDLLLKRFSFRKLTLQSKIVIATTLILLVGGAVSIFGLEQGGKVFENMPLPTQILTSLFQSVTARTAGFNTVDLSSMTTGAQFVIIMLMIVGGSPSSTAGGMKTTTLAVQVMSIRTIFKGSRSVEGFGRSIEDSVVRSAACVSTLYIMLSIISAIVISFLEKCTMSLALFESVSAIATVGVTLGITGKVHLATKLILTGLMIFGRTGSLTILLSFASDRRKIPARYPREKIQVG